MMMDSTLSILKNIDNVINRTISFIIIPICTILNLVSILVLRRKHLNKTNMGVFYIYLVATHTISLLYNIFVSDAELLFNYNLLTTSDFFCKLFSFLNKPVKQMSPWLQITITLHRFVYYKFPAKAKFFSKYLIISMLVIFCIITGLSTTNFFYYLKHQYADNFNQTSTNLTPISVSCTAERTISLVSDIEVFLFRILIVFLVILVLTLVLYFGIYRNVNLETKDRALIRENHFTYVQLVLNIFYLIFNAPILLAYIAKYTLMGRKDNASLLIDTLNSMSREFSNLYYSSFFVLNFVFNSLFRAEFFGLLDDIYKRLKLIFK